MNRVWGSAVIGAAALAAAALCVPALQAEENAGNQPVRRVPLATLRGGIGTFTPAAADPRLAAALARAGLGESGFRFTPAESRKGGISKRLTVAVQARSVRPVETNDRVAALPETVGLTPIAYNLGVSVGWKRFALAGEVVHFDLAGMGPARDSVDVGLSYSGKRVSGRLKAGAERPLRNAPPTPGDVPSYSIDVGGSYSLTRNFDVTAGVRYKSEDANRLPLLTQDDPQQRRDSRSVYIGTAFRF